MTMEVNYGVAVTNKFALFLNDDEDPLDILKLEEENKIRKLEKKKSLPTDKDAKIKNKANKAEAPVDQKKPTATTAAPKKEDKVPVRTKGKPAPGESIVVEKKQGKENDVPRRERREDAGNRPRPPSGTPRDLPPREGFNRPERSGEQGEQGGFQSRPSRGSRPQRFERGGFADRGERPEFGGEKVEEGEGARVEFRRGGGGGRGRGRGGFRGGKREFDRHSGSDRSGVKPQDKRDGAGAHNWGTISDEIQEQLNVTETTEEGATWGAQVEAAEAQPNSAGVKPEGGTDTEASPDAEAAEQEKVLTLDEWKAQQEAVRMKAEFNIRKPGEGCATDPQWKKMVVLKKKENDEEEGEEEEEEEESHHGRQKTTVPIEIRFNQAARRGGPGGRGGRGRGGRGGASSDDRRAGAPAGDRPPRGPGPKATKEQKAPSLSDELDFPSLDKAVGQ